MQLPTIMGVIDKSEESKSNEAGDFHLVQDDCEKEKYLILIVHGIGSTLETQTNNKQAFDSCINYLTKGGFIESDY